MNNIENVENLENNDDMEKTEKNICNKKEKKIILYLIIISIILIYFSCFFIHNIVDRGRIQETASGTVTFPGNEKLGDNYDKDNENNVNSNKEDSNKDNSNKGDSGDSNEGNNGYVVDNSDRFKVTQASTGEPWSVLKELDIFKNSYFEDKSIIAPGVHGEYSFTIENETESRFNYDIKFTENNPYNINMVFKLRINGEYVVGDESTWGKFEELSRTNLYISSISNDIYTIEWKWEDASNDTEVGKTEGAYYKANIEVKATQIVESTL